jgi:hypothetical protein
MRVYPHCHVEDLDNVLDKGGAPVFVYSSVPLKSINHKRALARENMLTAESIAGSLKHASIAGIGQESQEVS